MNYKRQSLNITYLEGPYMESISATQDSDITSDVYNFKNSSECLTIIDIKMTILYLLTYHECYHCS